MSIRRPVSFFAVLAAALAACPDPRRTPEIDALGSEERIAVKPAAQPPPMGDAAEGEVVAILNGEKITRATIDAEIAADLQQAEREHERRLYELRSQAIQQYLSQRLMDAEARRQGFKDSEELILRRVEEGAVPPTDEEVRAFYEESKDDPRMGGATLESLTERIQGFLLQQKRQERFNEMVEGLQARADIEVLLRPVRVRVDATGFSKGPESAPVTIVEFSDFECPYCSRSLSVMEQLRTVYGEQLRLIFRDFPLSFHPNALKAAEAGQCAGAQGKFWEMHDLMFSKQNELGIEQLKAHARTLGVDGARFDSCLDTSEKAAIVAGHMAAGAEAGVTGTPAFFVNGVFVTGAQGFDVFKDIIDQELAALPTAH